ncbi:MAG: hypothetical protein GC204_11360 [Chloroflexi bacterium]|nr:hypothetical protein [Chloroflexota bacterium]
MQKHVHWLLLPLFLLTTYLSARSLTMDALWLDEWWTIHISGGSSEGPLTYPQTWERAATEDNYWPPGYILAYATWGRIFGWSAYMGRVFSLLAGLLGVAWVFRLGTDLFNWRVGLLAAILIGTSAYFIYFLHELRGYVFFVPLISMTVWAYWQSISGRKRRRNTMFLFFGSFGLLYLSYLAALTLVVLGIYHLLFVAKNRRWLATTLTMTLPGILFLPWFSITLNAMAYATQDKTRAVFAFTPLQSAKGILYMFSNGCIALLALFGLYSFRRTSTLLFAWFWGIGIFILLIAVNARYGVVLEVRYLFPIWPVLAVIAGYGADRLLSDYRRPALIMVSVWVAAGIWNSVDPQSIQDMHNPHWHLPWDVLTPQVKTYAEPADALTFVLPDWTWSVYHTGVYNYYLHGIPLLRHTLMERPINVGYENYKQQVQALVAGNPLLWVAHTPAQPTLQFDIFKRLLSAQNYLYCATVYDSPILQFDLYSSPTVKGQVEPINFGADGITLASIRAAVHTDQERLDVTQIWSVAATIPTYTYSVGLHIDNAEGQLVAQADYPLPQQAQSCTWSQINLSGLAPGNYQLLATVYNTGTGERLMATNNKAINEVDRFMIMDFSLP